MKDVAAWLLGVGLLATGMGLLWPWIERLGLDRFGLGHLPGDLDFRHPDFRLHLPLTSALMIAVSLTALVWLGRHLGT